MSRPVESDPLRELLKVQQKVNDLCENAMARMDFAIEAGFDAWAPVSDVYESADALVMCLELPGLTREQIELRIDGDELVVEGERQMDREQQGEQFHRVERSYGKFSRRFNLPSAVDRESVQASYRDGLLVIRLPRKDVGNRGPVRVPIG